MQWHIALAQPNKERLAFSHLQRLRYEAQYPLLPKRRVLYGKSTIVYLPMFRGYVFVRLGYNNDWYRLETAPGIRVSKSMLAFPDGHRATITEEEMSLVRAKAKEECGQILEPEKQHDFETGDRVRVKIGPFADILATIDTLDDEARTAVLEVYLLGRYVKSSAKIDHLTAA